MMCTNQPRWWQPLLTKAQHLMLGYSELNLCQMPKAAQMVMTIAVED